MTKHEIGTNLDMFYKKRSKIQYNNYWKKKIRWKKKKTIFIEWIRDIIKVSFYDKGKMLGMNDRVTWYFL